MEDRARSRSPADQSGPDADGGLLEQIRAGDAEAGHRFVREHYPAIYCYLLHLTRQPDMAEDLTQETFLQGWRRLETFQGRGSLRSWLYRIAHREFLHLLQRRQAEPGLETMAELAAPDTAARLDSVELRDVIDRLSLEQREVVLLYYLEGYSSTEIARIVEVPVGTVCSRLARAREHLRRELGEDDLTYLNEPLAPMHQWAWLPLDQMYALETRLPLGGEAKEDAMERREFLRHAAAGAVGLALAEPGKEIVDGRLTQKVTLAFKATALSDLCDHLTTTTGISLIAGASVADEKVTVFCKQMPVRDVMRQLSRPFGYAWLRSKREDGEYRYELVQDLRSQLLEEELRNRDRHAALLALEQEIERYRPYLSLSPDQALARSQSAPPEEKELLERLAGPAWGAIQIYFRLSPAQMAALHAGKELKFRVSPGPAEEPLPPEIARGVLESQRHWRIRKVGGGYSIALDEVGRPATGPDTSALTALPELRGKVNLSLRQSELGQFALYHGIGWQAIGPEGKSVSESSAIGHLSGSSAAIREPERSATARSARDPALQSHVTVRPQPSYRPTPDPEAPEASIRDPKVTVADVLEALHRASGLPIVSDYYTRLYPQASVTVGSLPIYDAVNQLAATMRLRWNLADGNWLQFRSASYYHDRLKEVPNRLLFRWAAARDHHGMLTLDDLTEIAGLPDSQLDGNEMAEGAREYFGLREWDLVRDLQHLRRNTREGLRFAASLTPAQRREAMSAGGLAFVRMSLTQQQRFLAIALSTERAGISAEALAEPLRSLDELAEAAFRIEYTQPGEFQWLPPESRGLSYPIVVPLEPGPRGKRALVPPARGQTRAAALEAARRIDARLREGLARIDTAHLAGPGLPVAPITPRESEIVPTRLDLWFVYFLGSARPSLTRNPNNNFYQGHRGRQ